MGLVKDERLHVKLTGSWETEVGEKDSIFHILEFENYGGYDKTCELIKNSEVRFMVVRVVGRTSISDNFHFVTCLLSI